MSTSDIEKALQEVGAEIPLEEPKADADSRRRRVVSQMQRVNIELVREGQKQRWLRWGVGGGLVAGAAAAAILATLSPFGSSFGSPGAGTAVATHVPLRTEMTKGSVTRVSQKSKQRLGLGDSLVLDEEHVLETESESRARVHGGRGLDIDVGPGSRVVVGAVDAQSGAAKIRLQRGLVNCSVDPDGEGPKLAVITPDAKVEVKGTIFSVEVMDENGTVRSCVRVQRGWVTVTRGGAAEEVRAGQSSGCESPESASDEPPRVFSLEEAGEVEETAEVAPAAPNNSSKSAARPGAGVPAMSSLAQQNSLLARALAAERNGKLAEAESRLSELLGRFPSTPLRADAEAARTRIRKRNAEQVR